MMNFPELFFKIRDRTVPEANNFFDYEIVVRQKKHRIMTEQSVKDVTVDHKKKKIYIWVD